jgi:hypothetical protein
MDSITQKGAVAIREKIVPFIEFIKSEKIRLCPEDSLFLKKENRRTDAFV